MTDARVLWKQRVASWRASGERAERFSAGRGFAASTLKWWRQTRARIVAAELECELGWLTVPEPPLAVAKPAQTPNELELAP